MRFDVCITILLVCNLDLVNSFPQTCLIQLISMGYVGVNTRGMGDQLANGQRLIRDSRVVAFQRCIR